MRGRARSCRAGEDREGSGAADMMSLYTTVPTKGAGALGAETEAARGPPSPEGKADFARSASGVGTSREAASDAGARGGADVARRRTPPGSTCGRVRPPLRGGRLARLHPPAPEGRATRAKRERGGDQPRSGFRRRRADEAPTGGRRRTPPGSTCGRVALPAGGRLDGSLVASRRDAVAVTHIIVAVMRIIVAVMRIIIGVFPHHRRGFRASSSGSTGRPTGRAGRCRRPGSRTPRFPRISHARVRARG